MSHKLGAFLVVLMAILVVVCLPNGSVASGRPDVVRRLKNDFIRMRSYIDKFPVDAGLHKNFMVKHLMFHLMFAAFRHRQKVVIEAYERVKDSPDDATFYRTISEAHASAFIDVGDYFYMASGIEAEGHPIRKKEFENFLKEMRWIMKSEIEFYKNHGVNE